LPFTAWPLQGPSTGQAKVIGDGLFELWREKYENTSLCGRRWLRQYKMRISYRFGPRDDDVSVACPLCASEAVSNFGQCVLSDRKVAAIEIDGTVFEVGSGV
jgi:hypothetical protein